MRLANWGVLLLTLLAGACGEPVPEEEEEEEPSVVIPSSPTGSRSNRPVQNNRDEKPDAQPDPADESGAVVQASWEIGLSYDATQLPLADVPIQITVPEQVTFEVDSAGFPNWSNGDALGSITLSEFRDNSLRKCGASGEDKCRRAVLRLYTKGNGPGLWHDVLGVGATLSSGDKKIGYQVNEATTLLSVGLDNVRVLKRNDWAFDGVLSFPITVDSQALLTNGYEATLVLEYALFSE